MLFDYYIAVDWSARSKPSPKKPSADAIWVGEREIDSGSQRALYFRTRYECIQYLKEKLSQNVKAQKRTLIGYDFNFGFPSGLAKALKLKGSESTWLKTWKLLYDLIVDDAHNQNNRFEVAAELNKQCGFNNGPFWGRPRTQVFEKLQATSPEYPFYISDQISLKRKRFTEEWVKATQPVWKLLGQGSVGSQTLLGIPRVYQLRYDPGLQTKSKIWPFETGFVLTKPDLPLILHTEIWPSLFVAQLDASLPIKDQAQVLAAVDWLYESDKSENLTQFFKAPADLSKNALESCLKEEGWILGI